MKKLSSVWWTSTEIKRVASKQNDMSAVLTYHEKSKLVSENILNSSNLRWTARTGRCSTCTGWWRASARGRSCRKGRRCTPRSWISTRTGTYYSNKNFFNEIRAYSFDNIAFCRNFPVSRMTPVASVTLIEMIDFTHFENKWNLPRIDSK